MTSAQFVLYLTCLFLGKMAQMTEVKFSSSVRQDTRFISVKTGDNLTLHCFREGDVASRYYWYKQTLGQKLRLISSFYKFDKNGTFHDEFKKDTRLTLDTGVGKNHLKITDLHISDSATYYCASSYSYKFVFAEGTTVSVKDLGLNIQALVHQSESETIQPGEHSVYWFKSSEESHPGLIYTHGDRNDQCERKHNTQTHTCVYNLPMKNLSLSHAGTYYCAVASCGHILFGYGTKLDIEVEGGSLVLVYFLSGALAFTTILSVLLTFLICFINKRDSCKCAGSENEENIHYAALREHRVDRSRRQRNNTKADCVYSRIKL
uniref:Ig-like domain-containing protein n=1 Tax=Lates calcarifer TaxID=8187 RepID=A0A4W6CVP1_LATCA